MGAGGSSEKYEVATVSARRRTGPEELKIVLGVGKSALTVQWINGTFVSKYDPTIEDSYRKNLEVDGRQVLLEILDTANGEHATYITVDRFVKETQGFVFVYSITSRYCLEQLTPIMETIRKIRGAASPCDIPLIVVGNKCDLDEDREVTPEEGQALAEKWGAPFFETSAKTRVNEQQALYEMVRVIRRREAAASAESFQGKAK